MFGLEYILGTYKMSNSDLAKKLQINRANISMWIKKSSIPEKKLKKLKELFPKVPPALFNKELKPSEEVLIDEIYFTETDEFEEIEIPHFDEETGEEILVKQIVSQHYGIITHLRDQHEKLTLIERLQDLLFPESEDTYGNMKMLNKFAEIMEQQVPQQLEFFRMIFYFLESEGDWGFDPFFDAGTHKIQMYEEFKRFLIKYKFID